MTTRPGWYQFVVLRTTLERVVLVEEDTLKTSFADVPVNGETVRKVLFSASKQKGAETRRYREIYELAYWHKYGVQPEACLINHALCGNCPRCRLFGASVVSKKKNGKEKEKHNLRARIYYSDSFSLEPYESATGEFVMVSKTQKRSPGGKYQNGSFMRIHAVLPDVHFWSVVSIKNPSPSELFVMSKIYSQPLRYGGRTGKFGLIDNHLAGLYYSGAGELLHSLLFFESSTIAQADEIARTIAEPVDLSEIKRFKDATFFFDFET